MIEDKLQKLLDDKAGRKLGYSDIGLAVLLIIEALKEIIALLRKGV